MLTNQTFIEVEWLLLFIERSKMNGSYQITKPEMGSIMGTQHSYVPNTHTVPLFWLSEKNVTRFLLTKDDMWDWVYLSKTDNIFVQIGAMAAPTSPHDTSATGA